MPTGMERLRQWFGSGAWCVDAARVVGNGLVLGGWIETADTRAAPAITVNGRAVDWLTTGIRLPNLANAFPFLPDARDGGFRARIELSRDELDAADARVECVDPATGAPLWPAQTVHVPLGGALDGDEPLPPPARIARVAGSNSADVFRLEGSSMARTIADTCARHGAALAGTRVLDWGVGCGRLARFLAHAGTRYVGADVDADNVAWCARFLAAGDYRVVPLHPPAPLDDAAFDVVVGISVVTHLREDVQLQWLPELARVAKPGGLVLLSILGEQGASRGLRGEQALQTFADGGFVYGKERHALDAILGDDAYYGTAFHHPDYVRSRWSRCFDVLEILPAAIGNHQDLVVLRSRGECGRAHNVRSTLG